MGKAQAAKLLKVTPRTLRRWLDDPSKSPHQLKEEGRLTVRVYLGK